MHNAVTDLTSSQEKRHRLTLPNSIPDHSRGPHLNLCCRKLAAGVRPNRNPELGFLRTSHCDTNTNGYRLRQSCHVVFGGASTYEPKRAVNGRFSGQVDTSHCIAMRQHCRNLVTVLAEQGKLSLVALPFRFIPNTSNAPAEKPMICSEIRRRRHIQ